MPVREAMTSAARGLARRSPSSDASKCLLEAGHKIVGHPGTLGQDLPGDVKERVIPRG